MHRLNVRSKRARRLGIRIAAPLVVAASVTAALLPGSGSARALVPPNNTTEPRISGEAREGRVLTASPGTWSGSTPMQFAYRWLRCPTDGGTPVGGDCLALNATTSTYRVRDKDVGLRLRVRVTATNADGSDIAASNATGIVQGSSKPSNITPPSISGSPVLGQTLTADPGLWSGTAPITYGYQWRSCNPSGGNCQNVAGATGRNYNLRQADVGTTLRFRVNASNAVGSTTATSVPTAVIAASAPTGCPGGSGAINVSQVTPPARLLVDRFQVSPNPIPRSTGALNVGFRVTACGGRPVAGALVYVTAVPYNQFAIPPEQQTGGDGIAILRMDRLGGFPAANNQSLLVMFVRARKGTEPVLSGISTRRLISFRLAK